MEGELSRDTSLDAPNNNRDMSDVLGASSYSLRDISTDSFANEEDANLLDDSVLALLDKPYSQLHDRLHLRKQDQYDGFDNSTGSSWIYPTNYPVRQYQYTITKAALFKNTLVVLPTGLGKTFIAAVVMYNIYRWYPTGKVIFMAPTRPLVNQQIEACYRIMGIPKEDTAEITGKQQRKNRAGLWQTKRVFYVTPQVVQADLCAPEQAFPVEQVRLIVIDEAHKAKGRYAYTEVVKMIAARNKHFRVLALSATPGRTLEDVAEVIQNLLISHIEVRWDNSIDVSPYTFRKSIRTIVIPLGATIRGVREQLLQLVDPYVRRLLDANVLSCGNPASMTRGMLIMEQKRFRENSLLQRHPNHSIVNGDFGVCVSMYHALDLLVRHGVRALLNFFADGSDGASEKYFVAKDRAIKEFLEQLRERYGEERHKTDGQGDVPATGDDDVDYGHPKYRILEKQLATHFTEHPESRAIVFCEFRDSVAMIHRLLSQRSPLIRPKCIVGQGGTSGIRAVTQKEQIAAMQQFRAGTCNTLIATCVAEEGIDVGEVDLIVCFDITKNPTRFVQRIGRTGRQRVGRVLMLVTEGEEHETLKRVQASKDRTNQQLAKSKDIMRILYRHSPRLVPGEFEPKCVEMFINIAAAGGGEAEGANAASGSGKGGAKRKVTTGEPDVDSKRRKVSTAAKPGSSTPKGTQDVRRFFQRANTGRLPADADLDASERDIFSLPASPPGSSPEKLQQRTSEKPVIDRCARPGKSDQQLAIDRILQNLVRHYEQLRRQKFIHRQQLLNVPTVAQILQRRSLAIVRSELARQLLQSTQDANTVSQAAGKRDDPFDLPPLRPIPESIRLQRAVENEAPCSPPSDVYPISPTQGKDESILNIFDSTLNYSNFNETSCVTIQRGTDTVPVAVTGNRKRTPPVDSPLLRAFNRSVQKRQLEENHFKQAGLTNTECHPVGVATLPEPETPPQVQRVRSRQLNVEAVKKTIPSDSPLLRAFNRSVQKRNNSDGFQEMDENELKRKMVLEFFHLQSLDDIFDAEELSDRMEEDPPAPMDVPLHQPVITDAESNLLLANAAESEKEAVIWNVSSEPGTSRQSATCESDKENKGKCKNFNLGSAALVFDDSDDDIFGEMDLSPVHRTAAQQSPIGRVILGETRQKEPAEHSSQVFSAVEKSPSLLARPVSKNSRLAPTKLNFQRLRAGETRQHSATTNRNDPEMSRPLTPVESLSSSPFFNTCQSSIRPSPSAIPPQPVKGPSQDLDRSTIIGHRRKRGCLGLNNDLDSEDDEDDVHPLPTDFPVTIEKEDFSRLDSEDDDIFESCKSGPSYGRIDRKSNTNAQVGQKKPETSVLQIAARSKKHQPKRRQAARAFLHTQAEVSGSEEEDENDTETWHQEMDSFIEAGGSQLSQADASCVDMRAVYLQSVRSPTVARGRFKIPATRANAGLPRPNTLGPADADDLSDNALDETEAFDSSFITDDIEVDSELSELEQAEMALRERRRVGKRAREKADAEASTAKRRRRIIVLSDSE
ncbi:Fanconi anemia group M protein homolog [Anopheles ziemanni]|uniref:Fanconi anemia group M protein homolog n=1 Tax=Anopheles coustani TaxID=139045 RepID=UPI0026583701|nr:Fanconi anemia group M protein homolog [Anopheles coustani]XP_058176258.1 Fanconi anemia group M protein homolog [Anopheles ziemanni]